MRLKSRHFQFPGFTLVELLVVIVIIVTLAALSLVGVNRMRDMADKTNAMRNLSRLQLANASFAADDNGRYVPKHSDPSDPGGRAFWDRNVKFLDYLLAGERGPNPNNPFSIPHSCLDPKVVRTKARGAGTWEAMGASYGMNETGIPSSRSPGVIPRHTMANVAQPALTMAWATTTDVGAQYDNRFTWFSKAEGQREGRTSNGALAYRHRDKMLAVFFDGHVQEYSRGDLEIIDRTRGGGNNPFWKPNPNAP